MLESLCFTQGVWPNALKVAEIVPVHKSKEKNNPSNYRPISLISNLAKILEKILHMRLLKFIQKSNILSKMKFGFLKKRSTNNALKFITNTIVNKLDKSGPIAITFLDLSKAFDTVDHKLLLKKLYNYGIGGNAQQLISCYLSGIF